MFAYLNLWTTCILLYPEVVIDFFAYYKVN